MWKWFNPWGEAARVQGEADATIAALRSWREQSTADHKHELIRLYDMITATEKRVKEAEQEARTTEQKTKEAEVKASELAREAEAKVGELVAELREAHEFISNMCEAHANRFRVGSIRLDPQDLTAKMRNLVSNVKVEFDPGRFLYVIYADDELPQKAVNVIQATLHSALDMNRT